MEKLIIVGMVVCLTMGIANMTFASGGKEKEPVIALVCSFLITGGGQVYNNEIPKGLLMLGGEIVCLATMIGTEEKTTDYGWYTLTTEEPTIRPISVIGALGISIWSMIDAYQGANRFNDALKQNQRVSLLLDKNKTTLCLKQSF